MTTSDPEAVLPPDSPAALSLERGVGLRKKTPRRSHATWAAPSDRVDPVDTLIASNAPRLQELTPIRIGRMLSSPFAFLRGSSAVMAGDLASTPTSGSTVQLCGDAHLANFGVYASPERRLVFDLNDFDETYRGPWEWDVKRLAASFVVASRENGYPGAVARDTARVVAAGPAGLVRDDPDRDDPRARRARAAPHEHPVRRGPGAAARPHRRARKALGDGTWRWLAHPRSAPAAPATPRR